MTYKIIDSIYTKTEKSFKVRCDYCFQEMEEYLGEKYIHAITIESPTRTLTHSHSFCNEVCANIFILMNKCKYIVA